MTRAFDRNSSIDGDLMGFELWPESRKLPFSLFSFFLLLFLRSGGVLCEVIWTGADFSDRQARALSLGMRRNILMDMRHGSEV